MRIEYYEKNGKIGVKYTIDVVAQGAEWETLLKEAGSGNLNDVGFGLETDLGFVPENIQKQGADAVQRHARNMCHAHMEKRKRAVDEQKQTCADRMKNTDHPIKASHPDGTRLKGRIVYHSPGTVVVKLEEPFETDHGAVFDYPTCWAAAMNGSHVFERDGSLTNRVIEDSRWALTHLYDKAMRRRTHAKASNLVDDLNKGEPGIVQELRNGDRVLRTNIRGLNLISLDPKKK